MTKRKDYNGMKSLKDTASITDGNCLVIRILVQLPFKEVIMADKGTLYWKGKSGGRI